MDSLEALFFNFMAGIGDPLDILGKEWILKYSDLVRVSHHDTYYLVDPTDPDDRSTPTHKKIENGGFKEKIRQTIVNDNMTHYYGKTDKKTYEKAMKNGSLMGLSFLPWSTTVLPSNKPDIYVFKHRYGSNIKQPFNPWRSELLKMKGQTIFILGASGFAMWYGGKWAYRKYLR